jgi:hypothetical protein
MTQPAQPTTIGAAKVVTMLGAAVAAVARVGDLQRTEAAPAARACAAVE